LKFENKLLLKADIVNVKATIIKQFTQKKPIR